MADLDRLYGRRVSRAWRDRLRTLLTPPDPVAPNPREAIDAPLGRWNLYLGGGGRFVSGYVNLDLRPYPGVNVAGDAETLPFRAGVFQRVECDAVLEHVRAPERVLREIERVLAPGGYAHIVTPFCHPYHAYPDDYRRFTPAGLKLMAGGLETVAEGWRSGPTATMIVFTVEYVKLLLPWRAWRAVVHGVLGWLLFPLRYLDLLLFGSLYAARLGNHCFVWLRKPPV
ncbi:MAG: methyltransferase domain-containing protein [Bryobacteraceae bacterium]